MIMSLWIVATEFSFIENKNVIIVIGGIISSCNF